jgi:hypothetical protein
MIEALSGNSKPKKEKRKKKKENRKLKAESYNPWT